MVLSARRPGVALASPPAAGGAALAGLTVLSLALAQGGFFPSSWRFGTAALAAAAALQALWTRPLPRPARGELAFLAVLAALLCWSLASAAWSVDPARSLLDAQRTLLYLTATVAFLLAGEGLPVGVLAATTAVSAWALGGRLLHGAHWDAYEGFSLAGPLGYANALGALAAIGGVLSLLLALRSAGRARVLAAAPLVLLLPTLALTDSRGSWLAAAVGAGVGLSLHGGRGRLAAAVLAAAAASLAVLLLVAPGAAGDRSVYWHVARHVAAVHPLAGTGAGTFAVDYARLPATQDAHSLYLQAAAELGVVGLLLVVALVTLPLLAGLRRGAAAPVAGLVVFALHAGIDWDWQMPAVTLAALALVAAVLRGTHTRTAAGSRCLPAPGQ